jgi:hypothetical protein
MIGEPPLIAAHEGFAHHTGLPFLDEAGANPEGDTADPIKEIIVVDLDLDH